MDKTTLEKLLQTEEVISNSELLKDLKELLAKNQYSDVVNYFPNSLALSTYQYLLDTKNINAYEVLSNAIGSEAGERHDQLMELALANNVDFSKLNNLPSATSIPVLEKLLNHGLALNEAARLVLSINHHYSNEKDINAQVKLLEFLVEKGASLVDVYFIPPYFSGKTYELLLKHGLKTNIFLNVISNIEAGEKHDQLMDLVLANKIDFSKLYSLPRNTSIPDLEKFLNHGLQINKALSLVINMYQDNMGEQKFLDLKHDLIEFLVKKGANINSIDRLDSLNDAEFLLDIGLKLEFIVKNIFTINLKAYNPENSEYTSASLSDQQIKLLDLAKEKAVDINLVFSEIVETKATTEENGKSLPYIIPEQIIEVLIKNYSLNPNLVLKYAIVNNLMDLIKLAYTYNADANSSLPGEDSSLFMGSLFNENIEIVEFLIEHGAKIKIDILTYIGVVKSSNFDFSSQLIKKFPDLYDNNQLYEIFRSHGASESSSRDFLDLNDLIKEYIQAKAGQPTSLSGLEIDLLDGKVEIENIEEYKEANFTNKYGYSPLHLAIIANRYDIAGAMVKNGFSVYTKNHNNITPLQLISDMEKSSDSSEFLDAILELIDDVDIKLGSGETLADSLIQNENLVIKTIAKSHDPLFAFFKEDADLFSPSKDLSKTYIAISHGDGFWSTGIWSTARLIVENYPDVLVHLVKDETLARGGEEFLKQFDAVINPGAGDSYPKLEEFTKADCSFSMNIEMHYQNMLEQSNNLNIPYLGMCAGAQHFAMYHGGSLRPLDGYSSGQHQVKFIEGTLPYFMSLTKDQRSEAIKNCEFPEISFKGDTAHHYAAVNDKLGNSVQLGAVSEDGVAMSYGFANGIRYATQFHPEHFYDNAEDSNTIHQKAWINNFVELARMHHDYRVSDDFHPIEYYAQIKVRLDECVVHPTCLAINYGDILLID